MIVLVGREGAILTPSEAIAPYVAAVVSQVLLSRLAAPWAEMQLDGELETDAHESAAVARNAAGSAAAQMCKFQILLLQTVRTTPLRQWPVS